MTDLISVVLPTYNRAPDLGRAIESVLAQTYPHFELIVVDDGSTDKTADVVLGIKDDRIQFIRHSENKGAAFSRNAGIRVGRGNYIAFLDSDDIWHPDKLEKQYKFLSESGPLVGGCVTHYNLVYPDKSVVRKIPIQKDFYRQSLLGCNLSPGSTLMFRKECLDKVGFQNETLRRFEDWEWQIRFSQHYAWISLPVVLSDIKAGHVADFDTCKKALEILAKSVQQILLAKDQRAIRMAISYELFYAALKNGRAMKALGFFFLAFLKAPFLFSCSLITMVKRKLREF